MNYANAKNIPYVVYVGENEIASGEIKYKDMESGEQIVCKFEDFLNKLK
jgi:histidyl-tRNA synthetase